MRILLVLILLTTSCASQIQVTSLPDVTDTIEYLKKMPMPLPDFINNVTQEIDESSSEICVQLNNGVLGQYTKEQTALIRNNSSLFINMQQQDSLLYYENMTSLSDGDGNRIDTGISQICIRLSDGAIEDKPLLAHYELLFPPDYKVIYMWTIQIE